MKVASVDRIGSWRPPNADTRAVAASRIQSIAPNATESLDAVGQVSARELPPLPVQRMDELMSRPVLQSDSPQPALQASTPSQAPTAATVDVFKPSVRGGQSDAAPQNERPAQAAAKEQPPTLLEQAELRQNPDKLTSLELASAAAAKRAADQARKDAAMPPKVPLSKMLMDQYESLWDASGKAVEAALAPPTPEPHFQDSALPASSSASSGSDVTYSVHRHGGLGS